MIKLDEVVAGFLEDRFQPVQNKLLICRDSIKSIKVPTELTEFKQFYANLAQMDDAITEITLKLDPREIGRRIEELYACQRTAKADEEKKIRQKYEQLIDSKKNELHEEAVLHNNTVTAEWASENQKYIRLEEKRRQLEAYSDVVQETCQRYSIVSSDCNIIADDFTVETLNAEYDRALLFLQKKGQSSNAIKIFRQKVPNTYVQISVCFAVFVICFTPLLDIFAILFFLLTGIKQFGVGKVVSTYARIYALTYNIQPLNMGYTETVDSSQLTAAEITDSDERLKAILDEQAKEIEGLNKAGIDEDLDKTKLEYASRFTEIQKLFAEKALEITALKQDIRKLLNEIRQRGEANEQDARKRIKYLCDRFSTDYALDTNFTLGLKDGLIEEKINVGHRNIIIRPGDNQRLLTEFMQVLLVNILLNVKGYLMDVTVIDPNSRCQDFMMFYEQELTKDSLHLNEVDLSTALKDGTAFIDKNMKEMHGMAIATFNKTCQEKNSTPREYKVIFVVSQPGDLVTKEEWLGVLRTSARYGLMFVVVTDADVSTIRNDVFIFNKPFEGITQSYPVQAGVFAKKFKDCYANLLKASKTPPLTYSTFMDRFVTEDKKWWNRRRLAAKDRNIKDFDNDYIRICPGYYEGDPDKADVYSVGHNGDVHAIGVGGSGAGKSVFLNFVILQLCTLYSPEELELWLVDFKGTEFSKYIASPLNDFKALPHVKACLCTSDGDFAGSLYAAFAQDSKNRNELFNTVGVKSLKDYNNKMKLQGQPEKRLPRILMINDEFQVIFQNTDPKVLDQIKTDMGFVAKLGRSTGNHMFFTSQSMSGTLSTDILVQFQLRFALKCAAEVSTAILDTKLASLIKEPNGFLYVRGGIHAGTNVLPKYRTPFINDERPTNEAGVETGEMSEVEKAICVIFDEAQKIGFKQDRVITYKESTTHSINEITSFYEKNKDRGEELKDLFLLGESMTYTPSIAPQHVKLSAKNNRHIFSVFNNYEDLVNFYKTILFNIRHAIQKCDFIINSQVADLYHLCELDKDIPEDLQMLATEKTKIAEFIGIIGDIYQSRVSAGKKDEPLYVICIGWDKGDGFGIEKDFTLVSRIQVLLQKCAEYHVHFIFICSSNGSITEPVRSACSYRICGKASENDSLSVLDTKQAYKAKMRSGFFYLLEAGKVTRGKIYQYGMTREIASDKLSF